MNTMYALPAVTNALPSVPAWIAGLGAVFVLWFLVAMVLKCYAMWLAATRREKGWFIALFFINTLGILELIYLARHHMSPSVPPAPNTWQ